MKKVFSVVLFLSVLAGLGWAGPWALLVNANTMNIHMLDLSQSPPRVYGPFLSGLLGKSGESLLDVAATADGRYAIVTNFYGHKIFRLDIADPLNPVILNTVDTGSFWPEGVAISPDGNFAVVADGASDVSNQVYFFNMANFNSPSVYLLKTAGGVAEGVGIAADGKTVIFCDNSRARIYYGAVNSAYSGLVSETELAADGGCLNVAISPDGKTVLTAGSWSGYVNCYQITSPGVVVPGATPKMSFHNAPQCIAFSTDGRYAYVLAPGYTGRDTLSRIRVNGVGNVTLTDEGVATLLSTSGTAYYGVHCLAIQPNQNYALVGYCDPTSLLGIAYVNLTTFQVSQITTGQGDTAGIAVFPDAVFPPTNLALSRVANDFIFYKEYVNRLTWQANSKNKIAISKYRIYVKKAADPDTSYQLFKEVDASVLKYDDRGLGKSDLFTYRLTSVNINGMESPYVVIGN